VTTDSELHTFIVRAKAATYAGDGASSPPTRSGSHDLRYAEGELAYVDSYFGDANFLGQEVVYRRDQPVWAMNYHGYLLHPELIDAAEAGRLIKLALTALYQEGRFLGGFTFRTDDGWTYVDRNNGEPRRFDGTEHITSPTGTTCYELRYHGGRIV
jgi:hypothetical protein